MRTLLSSLVLGLWGLLSVVEGVVRVSRSHYDTRSGVGYFSHYCSRFRGQLSVVRGVGEPISVDNYVTVLDHWISFFIVH